MDSAKWKTIKETFSVLLDLPEESRADFLARETDEEIRQEVEKLLSAHESAEDFIEKPFLIDKNLVVDELADDLIGKQIENYQILERIGAGGMGAVYLAERLNSDFKQKVALKIIKRGMDSEAILKRFANERRILSTLKHPNIAGLLDGGISKEGLPFFVMEFVDGKPLNQFCDDNNLLLNERLEIFRQICAAVEHAHKNLIVHRDLKPSNILVTSDGIPKLLDFGIAKLLFSDDLSATETQTQGRIFTPEYASPEQILGKTVTTSTDVYSLGVILYELLSGHRPFETKGKSFDEIIKSVCETEPTAPSEAVTKPQKYPETDGENNPQSTIRNLQSLRGDLDNIILKALRKESSERYGSVSQFAEDIFRFLQGLPVLARPNTWKYRFGKYVKRHKAGVLAAALVLLSLVGGISVATWQAVVARRERAKAEQRFKDVRQLANSIVFEFHDSIEKLPGSTPTRELLVSRALEYLDKLASESASDLSLQMELADAYEKIGDIQGGFGESHLGQREKSFESYSKALNIRENLVKTEPSNIEFRQKLAFSYRKMSDAFWVQTDVVRSLENQQKAFEIHRKLNEEVPDNQEIRYNLAMSQSNFGRMLAANGKTEESLVNVRQAAKVMEELEVSKPNDLLIKQSLALSYERVAEILTNVTDNHLEARSLYLKSLEITLKLLTENPQNIAVKKSAGVGYLDLSEVSGKLNDYSTALDEAQKSLAIFEKLSAEDPQNEEFRQIVAVVEIEVCEALIMTGKASEAVSRLQKSLATLQQLKAKSPSDEIIRFRFANVYENLGKAHAALASWKNSNKQTSLSNWQTARDFFQKGFEIYKDFRDTGKTVGEEAAKVDELAEEITKTEQAIAKLK